MLPKSDRIGLLLFALLCAAAIAAFYFFQETKDEAAPKPQQLTAEQAANLRAFNEELQRDSIAWTKQHERHWQKEPERMVESFPFDPNTADSTTLLRLGFKPWQAKAICNYRRKGGRWRSAEDCKRIYGFSEADYQRLKPYIRISPEFAASAPRQKSEKQLLWEARQAHFDSLRATYPTKYEEGSIRLNLSTCDTTALKGIPGIGPWSARKIVAYRERLGGFVSVRQLEEIEDMPEGLSRWFDPATATTQPRQIDINHASFKTINRHPYVSYEQTIEIVNYIRKHGPLRSWNDLSLSKLFTAKDFERLKPYFRIN